MVSLILYFILQQRNVKLDKSLFESILIFAICI